MSSSKSGIDDSDGGLRESEGRSGIEAVHFALDMLELLAAEERSRGITELAAMLGTSKARVYRYLKTLRERGYVRQDGALEKYSAGVRLYILGQSIAGHFDLIKAARRPAERLRDELGLSVSISMAVDDELVCVDILTGRTPIEIRIPIGSAFPLHCSAGGKLALAYGSPGVSPNGLEGRHARLTPTTIVDPDALKREIARCKRRGWAMACEEGLVGINALAAPVFAHDGSHVGSIAVVGSVQMVPPKPDAYLIDAVLRAARDASQHLGWTAPLANTSTAANSGP